jgi:hypothetical protein
MFKVVTTNGACQEFERWTDALNHGKALMPSCKSLLEDIRILICEGDREDVVWMYSRSHKFPMYVGPKSYDRLAQMFLMEALAEAEGAVADAQLTDEPAASQELMP